jgi:radical SAM superfamily enzyme YgiQ (UPF0313 family)
MFRILALNPPFLPAYSRQSRSPCVTKGGTIYYPYYLAYAAGVAEQAGFDVRLVDGVTEGWSHDDAVRFARKYNPDLVVIDTSTPSIKNDVEVAAKIKLALPAAHINLVGTFPTNMAEECFRMSPSIDSVCRGEYDYTVRSLARRLSDSKDLRRVNGLTFRHNGEIITNREPDLVRDLDSLPWASRIYMKHFGERGIKKYFYASITWPEIQILTARGCRFVCGFCNIPAKGSYRMRSVKDVADEFEWIEENMPFLSEIMLEDDTFPMDKKRTLRLCDELISRGIKVTWSCNARVNTDLETMQKMKEAGCRLLCVGFESPTQSSLNSVSKGQTGSMERQFMENVRKTGLLVNGCFILGLPTDTPENMQATIDFAKELNPNSAQFYPLMVYPGTAAYEWARSSGFLETEDWSRWITEEGLHRTTVSRPGLSSEELLHWCNKARLEFYTNPRFLGKMVKQAITSPREAVRIFKGSRVLLKHILRYAAAGESRAANLKKSVNENAHSR